MNRNVPTKEESEASFRFIGSSVSEVCGAIAEQIWADAKGMKPDTLCYRKLSSF
ncbi:MAG: hypothetical protein N2V76_02270 [Methanophagales archaeon]|nr:hypothetical protein [Methanophagales archaeon]